MSSEGPQRRPAERTLALTAISPLRRGAAPWLRGVLQILPTTRWGQSQQLQELSFIQSARWTIIDGLPGPNGKVGLGYDYLLFEANFNGTEEAYLQAFSDVLATRMRLIWGSSLGFPNYPRDDGGWWPRRLGKPIPGRDFVRWVQQASLPVGHHYSAYPEASNSEVLAGLQAERLAADLRGLLLGGSSAGRFAVAFADGLRALQRPGLAPQPTDARGDVRGQLYAFTSLMPLRPEAASAVRARLAALGRGASSPFARLPGCHFGRWVVLDSPTAQPGQRRDFWPTPYLLTTTTTDGAVSPAPALAEQLREPLDRVLGDCLGYPQHQGTAAVAAYLSRHQLRSTRFYAGYPFATVGQVRSGLDTHARLGVLAGRLDHPDRLVTEFTDLFLRGRA